MQTSNVLCFPIAVVQLGVVPLQATKTAASLMWRWWLPLHFPS